MAVFRFIIQENRYHSYYTGNCNCIILPDDFAIINDIKIGDTAVLRCQYYAGELDRGRYLSPIYRTIIYIGKANVNDVGFKYTIISIK